MSEAKKAPKKPIFEINDWSDLKKALIIAKGGDPDAIQAVTDFMNLKNPTERANFMDKTIMLAVAQQDGFSKIYPQFKSFKIISEVISTATMGYKSKKSDQLTQIIQQTPNLADLQTQPEEVKQGIRARLGIG